MPGPLAIRVTIDGRDAVKAAQRLRSAIEVELASGGEIAVNTAQLQELTKAGAVAIQGQVAIQGLTETAAQLQLLRAETQQRFIFLGSVDIHGLKAARQHMAGMREDAGALGRAIASGLGRQWVALEQKLVGLQSQITGLVRAGEAMQIAPDMLEAMPQLEAALSSGEKKTFDLTLRMQELQARIASLNRTYAELGQISIQPLGGGALRTLSQMMKGITEPYHRGKVRKAVKGIQEELAPLERVVGEAMAAARQQAEAQGAGLVQEIAQVKAAMEAHLAARPPGYTVMLGAWTEEQRAWEAQFKEMEQRFLTLNQELQSTRTAQMTGDAQNLKDQLVMRRRELEGPLREDFIFWKEWSMESVREIADALRAEGQGAAADALLQMKAIFEERKRLQTQMKRAFGGMLRGAEVELPKGAKGTMVDFVTAEKALANAASDATQILLLQQKTLTKLMQAFDQAAMAARGMGEAERYAAQKMAAVAKRQIRVETKAGIPMEQAAAGVQAVMAELAVSIQKMQAEMVKAMETERVAQAAQRQGSAVVRVWEWVRERLVGKSIIPEMVHAIELWLASIGQAGNPFAALVEQGGDAAQQIIQGFAEIARTVPAAEIAAEIRIVTDEVRRLEQQFMDLEVRGSQASEAYKRGFTEAAAEVRRVLGATPEVEGRLAQGMLPVGFGVGARESQWQKQYGVAKARYGTEREGERWYQAIKTDLDEIGRQETEEMDRLAGQIVERRARLAALQHGQMLQMADNYERAVASLQAGADPAEQQAVVNQLTATYDRLGQSEDELLMAVQGVVEHAALETEREAQEIQAKAQEFAVSEAGRGVVGAIAAQQKERIIAAKAEAAERAQAARAAATAQIQEEKRVTAETISEAKARQKQQEEAAKRATIQARAASQAKIEAAKRQTAQTRAQIKEEARLARAQETRARQETQARRLAAQLGIQWDRYIAGALQAGVSIEKIVGTLQRIDQEQRQMVRGASAYNHAVRGAYGGLARFGRALSRARMEAHGVHLVLMDIGNMGRMIQYTSAALAGSLTMAAKQYLELARQTDIASRSLLLNEELTQELRHEVVAMAADLALLDPQATAQGVTIWAQATGQAVDSHEALRSVLEQTIPVQQLSALVQENIGLVTDGTAASLRQFGLGLDETSRVTAIFNKVADDTLATVGNMAEAMKYVGPQAREMGETIEGAAAVIGVMADQNIRGSQAGRAYRQMLISLSEPSQKAKDLLETTFGDPAPFYDAQGAFVGLTQVVDMLAAATEDASDQERDLLINTLFTANAVPAVTALVTAQIEARKQGINVIRAEAKLLEGTIDQEVKAYADLRREAEGVNITMMGAMELWERQLDDWEESDVYRVRQAEMRWKSFWLAIGESALNYALPHLERGASLLERVTREVHAHPALGNLVAVAAGGTIAATLLRVVVGTLRTVHSFQTMATALNRTMAAQQTAGQAFNTQVISAGERFAQLVMAAGEQSAATEVAGAHQETAIEVAGAQQEAAIGQSSAVKIGSFLSRAILALTAGEVLSRALTGQGLAGWFTTREGIEAGEMRAASELAQVTQRELQEALQQVRGDLEVVRRYASSTTGFIEFYGGQLEILFGKTLVPEDYERMLEIMGTRWQALSSTAMEDKLAELETFEGAILEAIGAFDIEAGAAIEASVSTRNLAGDLYQLADGLREMAQLTEEEQRAVDLYIEMLQKQEEALENFNAAMADALADLQADLADMESEYLAEIAELGEQQREEEVEAQDRHNRDAERAEREHAIRMRRMREDHLLRMSDLARARDAMGMVQERRNYEIQRGRAEEDFQRQQAQREGDFQRQQAERRRQTEQRIAELQAQHERERAERMAEYNERVAEIQAQHDEEMARLEQEYFDKVNAELGYYKRSKLQQALYHQAMLADARVWLEHNRQLWLNYLQTLPTPQYGGSYPEYQAGGYVGRTGVYRLHTGEYVLSPATTRQIERSFGGPLTQAHMVAGMGPAHQTNQINAHLTVVQHLRLEGSLTTAEKRWFRDTAREQAHAAFEEVIRGVV
jgi:TP901 family phage tail tape measure protein